MDYEEFEMYGTDWEDGGYFGCPLPNKSIPGDWTTYLECLEQAKHGRFDDLSKLVTIVTTTERPVLEYVCIELLGDAAPSDVLEPMLQNIREKGCEDQQLHYSHALSIQGRLASVLPMLSIYVREHEYEDAAFVPIHISRILGAAVPHTPRDTCDNVDDYAALVAAEYEKHANRFGTEEVLLYEGELLSVGSLMAELQAAPDIPWWLRRRFEAMTGIDCSSFYKEGIFQPLSANALVEDFAESPSFKTFTPGVRYFFGRPIP